MKKSKLIKNSLFVTALVAATFYILLKDANLINIIDLVKNLNVNYLLIGVICGFAFIICEGLNTYLLLNAVGEKVSIFRGIKYACIGFFFSSITPSASGGQPMQIYHMKKDRIDISNSMLILIVELISYQLVTLLLAFICFVGKFNFINDKIAFIKPFLGFGVFTNLIVIVFIVSLMLNIKFTKKIVYFIIKILNKIRIIKDLNKAQTNADKQIIQFKGGINLLISKPSLFIRVFFNTILQLISMYSIVFFVYKAFGLGGYSYFDIMALQSTFALSMCALPLPGAIGINELSFLKVFSFIFTQRFITSAMLVNRGISFYLLLFVTGTICIIIYVKNNVLLKTGQNEQIVLNRTIHL